MKKVTFDLTKNKIYPSTDKIYNPTSKKIYYPTSKKIKYNYPIDTRLNIFFKKYWHYIIIFSMFLFIILKLLLKP